MTIRSYRDSDFEMICSWWKYHQEPAPAPGMMVEDGTFVSEFQGMPIMTVTAFKTQGTLGFIEGYCAKPQLNKILSHEVGRLLWNHCFEYLKNKGARVVICYADQDKLIKRYEELGMTLVQSHLSALVREL